MRSRVMVGIHTRSRSSREKRRDAWSATTSSNTGCGSSTIDETANCLV